MTAVDASLRLARASDGVALAAIYAPAVTGSAISFELEPPAAAVMAERALRTLEQYPWLVCETAEGVIGYAYASRHRDRPAYQWTVEVSAYVAPAARGRGVATALYTSLFAVLVLQQFRNAYAGITLPNDASVRLHETLGFTRFAVFRRIGYKFGRWHDVGWYERTLLPHVVDPAPPLALPELLDSPELPAALDAGRRLLRAAEAQP
jgi:L-amino acid N-acyltransferase YncA